MQSRWVERAVRSLCEIQTIYLPLSFSLRAVQSVASQKCLGKEQNPACRLPHHPLGPDVQQGMCISLFFPCAQRQADIGKSLQWALNDV